MEQEQPAEMGRGQRARFVNVRYRREEQDNAAKQDTTEQDTTEQVTTEQDTEQDESVVDANNNIIRNEKIEILGEKKEEVKEAKELLEQYVKNLDKFVSDYDNVPTEEDFVDHAEQCVAGSLNKHFKLYLEDTILARTRKAFCACKLFDM